MKTIIEVNEYGDFNVLTTRCIMTSEEHFTMFDLKAEFCKNEQIESFTGLPYDKLTEYTNKFVEFLKNKGFKPLVTKSVYFCD